MIRFFVFIFVLSLPLSVAAGDDRDNICYSGIQSAKISPLLAQATPKPEFGEYGFGHKELHEFGAIQELMKKTGKECCDGGGKVASVV